MTDPVPEKSLVKQLVSDFSKVYGGRYQELRMLGQGASGCAFRAYDMRRRVPVCIKLFHGGVPARGAERDWHITSTLKHPAVADTFTVEEFESAGTQCLAVVSRLIEGHTLQEVLGRLNEVDTERQVDLSLALLDAVSPDLCDAVAACHALGFGHGDLHERNVILRKDSTTLRAVIIDFDNATISGPAMDESERRASDIRALRRLIGCITQGWKWHEQHQRLLDGHRTVQDFRGALVWGSSFLKTADRRTGNSINLKALCQALYHHNFTKADQPAHAQALLQVITAVAAELGLRNELAEAHRSWRHHTRNQFSWRLAAQDGEPELDPVLAELWPRKKS